MNLELITRGARASSVSVVIGQPDGNSILAGKLIDPQSSPWQINSEVNPKIILLDGTLKETSYSWLTLAKGKEDNNYFQWWLYYTGCA